MNSQNNILQSIKSILIYIRREMSDPFYSNVAPGLAYYFLLSIAPIMIILSYATSIVFSSSYWITDAINRFFPQEIAEMIIPFVTQGYSSSGLFTTIIVFISTLYLASKGLYALIKVSDYASDNFEKSQLLGETKTFLRRHLKAIILTFMMLLMIVISLVVMVFGKIALEIAGEYIELRSVSLFLYDFYDILTYPAGLAILFLLLLIFYSRMPTIHLSFKEVLPGALFASLGLVLASSGFVVYLRFFFDSNAIYGALSGVIILLLWFFLIAHVLVLGIIINKAFKDIFKK